MAPTSLKTETLGLTRLADRDLAHLWTLVARGASAEVALRDLLPTIVREYGEAGAAMAADWYDDQRDKVGVKGRFTAIPMEADDRGSQALVGWALNEAQDDASLKTLIAGGVQRRIADHVRGTVMGSSVADPKARGWQRVGDGKTCEFCRMLIGRGAVYTESTADFTSHDHCGCAAAPAWSGIPTITAAPAPVPATPASRFTPDELRNALDPKRKRTAAAIKKELEGTVAGRDLATAIKGFTETRGGVANLRKNIENTIDGSASAAVQARSRAFLDAMNTYPTEDVPKLFRGVAVKVEEDTDAWWDAFEGQFQPGQKFTLNASSFSSSEKKAAEFSGMIGGTKKATGNHTAVRMVLEGDTHALPVEQLSKFKSEKEWITGGEFEVVGYEAATPKNPFYKVTVRQVKKLEAP